MNVLPRAYVGVWSEDDSGDVAPRWTIAKGHLYMPRGLTLDPKKKTVIVSDKYMNSVMTFSLPELYNRPAPARRHARVASHPGASIPRSPHRLPPGRLTTCASDAIIAPRRRKRPGSQHVVNHSHLGGQMHQAVPLVFRGLLISSLLHHGLGTGHRPDQRDGQGPGRPGVAGRDDYGTQTATGLTRTAVTDDTGSYVLQNLPIGPYPLEATLQGFRTYQQTGIVLQVGANPTLAVTLQLGQLEETVTVAGHRAARGNTESRHWTGHHQPAGAGTAAEWTAAHRVDLPGRALGWRRKHDGSGRRQHAQYGDAQLSDGDRPGGRRQSNGLTYILDGGTHNEPFNNLNQPLPLP